MTRKIAVFTGSRAEFGLLSGLMRLIEQDGDLTLQTIAASMHFAPEFGLTWQEIEAEGFAIDARVEMLLASDTRTGVAKSLGLGTLGMADALDRLKPDLLIILGDRFEALSAAQAALIMGIPIAHIHGGEISEGAYDDAIRHAITKMAALHFVAAEPYRKRVIQMGTPPDRVFNTGAPGLDKLLTGKILSLAEIGTSLGFDLRTPYFLATYHPATTAAEDPLVAFGDLCAALAQFPDHQVVMTYPNADHGGRAVIEALKAHAAAHPGRVLAVPSLGLARYGSVMAQAAAVVGNSSSGLIEAPSFRIPTVNIGSRQAGRLAASSVRHVGARQDQIAEGLAWAISGEGRAVAATTVNPYGQGRAAEAILAVLKTTQFPTDLPFYDFPDPNVPDPQSEGA